MSCGGGGRCGLDPMMLWLWCRLVATALIRPLAWEPPDAEGAALEKAKKTKKKRRVIVRFLSSKPRLNRIEGQNTNCKAVNDKSNSEQAVAAEGHRVPRCPRPSPFATELGRSALYRYSG